ncbi:MAG TPA: 6-phosphogluconolactonase [Candidatus Rubrimentiphilum sp.]|nr:6-phosphogluconolactonase [Candidatus Rubrimentiphilum sp.]
MSERNCGELRIYETPGDLEKALADLVVTDAKEAIRERGAFYVALAGGRTPQAAYALLAANGRRDAIDWQHVFIYFGDERCVPPESDDSNYKMASDALLSMVPVPPQNVHRMHGEDDPARAARAYAQALVETMGESPRFDLILLGMGADGHTASLFPQADPGTDDDQLVRAVYVEKLGGYRLTLTPRVINNARHVAIALVGSEKAPILRVVREGPYDPVNYPVQIVSPVDGTLTWLVDRSAAAPLTGSG